MAQKNLHRHRFFLFGNPILDHFTEAGESALTAVREIIPGFSEEEARHIGAQEMDRLLESIDTQERGAGGGALTTAAVLARLGESCSFTGSRGEDEEGRLLESELARYGVDFHPVRPGDCADFSSPPGSVPRSGRSLYIRFPKACGVIVAPAAAAFLTRIPRELTAHIVSECGEGAESEGREAAGGKALTPLFYIEGFLLPRRELIRDIIRLARSCSAEIVVDLGARGIVETCREESLAELLPHTRILFGTEEECDALAGTSGKVATTGSAFRALTEKYGFSAIVKRGAEPAILFEGGRAMEFSTYPSTAVRDATGAGDILAAGCLAARSRGYPLSEGIHYGLYLASMSLQSWGASALLGTRERKREPIAFEEVESFL